MNNVSFSDNPNKNILTGKELVKYYGNVFSYWWLMEAAKKGLIPCIKLSNKKILFSTQSIDEYFREIEKASIKTSEEQTYGILRKINP